MNERCPSAETLAAYADGRMAREERSAVTEHLLGCDDCYEVVSEVGALREELEPEVAATEARPEVRSVRAFPARGIGIALAVAAVLAVVFFAGPLRHRLPFAMGDAELRALAAAIEEERPIEPRVASFDWAPLRPVARGGSGSGYELLAAAAKIEKSAGEDPSGEDARRLGIARLLLGEWDASIELLARAAEEDPSATTLSDLAAAKIARGVATGSRSDFLEAYEDAARAVAADPRHEGALFNRALALHRSGINADEAARAWNDYLAVDATSGWAEEARAHLGELGATPNASSSSSVDALLAHLEMAQLDEARTIIDLHPLETRLLFEERLLGDWGRAFLAGDETAARRSFDSAARLAGELGARGDPAPKLAIAFIETAPPPLLSSLARGHSLYSSARMAYRNREYVRAGSEAAQAERLLEGSPHASLAALLRSSVAYVRRDLDRSARLLVATESNDFSSPSILGQIDWMRGLILIQEGRSFEALEPLERGAKRFAALGELENAAAVRLMSAYALDELGETGRAWETRVDAAVDTLGSDAPPARRHTALFSLAEELQRRGMPRAAILFADRVEREAGDDLERRIDALQVRSQSWALLGNAPRAVADLEEARRAAMQIGDERVRERSLLFIDRSAASALASSEPAAALAAAGDALARATSLDDHLRLAEMQLARGRLLGQLADRAGAEEAFRAALSAVDRASRGVDDERLRLTHLDTAGEIVEALALLLVDSKREREAFDLVTSARGKWLANPAAVRASSPGTIAVARLVWVVLDDQTLLWAERGEVLSVHRIAAGERDLERAIARFARDPANETRARMLFDNLLAPAADAVAGAAVLRFSPDGPLHALPFAALRDPEGRLLIESHAIAIAPAATRCCAERHGAERGASLVLGNPSIPSRLRASLRDLPGAASEARSVAAVIPGAEVLVGPAATAQRFLEAAPRASLIHVAAHAVPNLERPESSLLVLADSPGRPGLVSARELSEMRLRSDAVVVLAGCRSAIGPIGALSGMDGLARAALAGGASAVIASLSDLDDRETTPILVELHHLLASGLPEEEALRRAQLAAHHRGTLAGAWSSLQLLVR